ncbi:porin [Massilia sp. SYSU DXS3249]
MSKPILQLSLCALAVACGAARAQNGPVVYGLVDLNFGHTTHVTPEGGAFRVNSGGMNTSRLGFSGSETIADGLKAVYGLEMGIAADTGVADSPLFKRQATVGLEGRFGSVLLGRAFTTTYDFLLTYDPMGYAPAYSWAPAAHGSGPGKYGMTFAYDNMIKYAGKAGPLSFGASYGASYGAGEGASTGDGAKGSVAASYALGPVSFVASAERVNEARPAEGGPRPATTVWHLGAMASHGPWKLQAAVRDWRRSASSADPAATRARLAWAGVNYQLTPALTLTGALYHQELRAQAGDATMAVARLRYALSRRTDLYAVGARARSKGGARVSLARDEIGHGDSQASVLLGIQHRF